jgi:hypothetical protein
MFLFTQKTPRRESHCVWYSHRRLPLAIKGVEEEGAEGGGVPLCQLIKLSAILECSLNGLAAVRRRAAVNLRSIGMEKRLCG